MKPTPKRASPKKVRPPYRLGTPAPTDLEREFVYMLVHGLTDTGKTSLAFTAPGPLCYIHCSAKREGLIQQANAKHIKQFGYPMQTYDFSFPKPPKRRGGEFVKYEDIEKAAASKWKDFSSVYDEAFTYARTIIIDTEYNLYQLIRFAHFGALMPNFPYERMKNGNADRRALWGPVNTEWYVHLRQAVKSQRQRTNVILITHSTDEYKTVKKRRGNTVTTQDEKTGNYLPDSQRRVPYWVDVRIETKLKQGAGSDKYSAAIQKPWYNEDLKRGTELNVTGSKTSFEDIMFTITDDLERWCK